MFAICLPSIRRRRHEPHLILVKVLVCYDPEQGSYPNFRERVSRGIQVSTDQAI